jgi:hypothetical protein
MDRAMNVDADTTRTVGWQSSSFLWRDLKSEHFEFKGLFIRNGKDEAK